MPDSGFAGYDPVYDAYGIIQGYNPSGSQGNNTQAPQGYVNGQKYYAPVPFNPDGISGVNAPGYLDFGSNYDSTPGSPGSSDYFYYGNYGEALAASNPTHGAISYGSGQTNKLAPGQGDLFINGQDQSSYAQLAAQGIGAPDPTSPNGVKAYDQYTEPGYRAPTTSQAAPQGTQSYDTMGNAISPAQASPTAFYFGDNGSMGSVQGTFSNNTPGQPSQFYQSQNPALQALTQSRSPN